MAGPNCYDCIYSVCDPQVWLRRMHLGEPVLPSCANHPQWPGQMHEVPGVPCRNYRPKSAVPQGDVRLIPLAEGLYAYVDAADYEWLSHWNWHLCSGGYAGRCDRGKMILMHRVIMQPLPGMVVDHIDGNRANNCRFNLRVCTRQENLRNNGKRRGVSSSFKGVGYSKCHHKWHARIKADEGIRSLGYFTDEVQAARAYDYAAVEECGTFARVNFPQEWPPDRRQEVYAQYHRRGESSFARTPVGPQRAKGKKIGKGEGKRDTPKAKAKANKKKAKPSRTRRKTNRSPQRSQRTQRNS